MSADRCNAGCYGGQATLTSSLPCTKMKKNGSLLFLSQETITGPRSCKFLFLTSPNVVFILIFEPVKMRQEQAMWSAIQGREAAVIEQILKSADHIKM